LVQVPSSQRLKSLADYIQQMRRKEMKWASMMRSIILLFSLCLALCLNSCLYSSLAADSEPGAIASPSIPAANMDMPTPKITAPNMDMPESNSKTQAGQNDSSKNSSVSQTPAGFNASEESSVSEEEEGGDSISGKWSVRFEDLKDRTLDLTLWSAGAERIMGFGTETKGSSSGSISASGSFAKNELILTVKPAQSEKEGGTGEQYDFDLQLNGNALSGTYVMTGGEISASGNATAAKRA